jgi:hypothetical protein
VIDHFLLQMGRKRNQSDTEENEGKDMQSRECYEKNVISVTKAGIKYKIKHFRRSVDYEEGREETVPAQEFSQRIFF